MGTVTLNGTLTGNPSSGGGFPSATFTSQLSLLNNGNKLFTNATGILTQVVSSPGSFLVLQLGGVVAANLFYLRTESDILVRVTQNDGSGGTLVSTFAVQGLFLIEPPSNKGITLVEVQGSASIEYFGSGT